MKPHVKRDSVMRSLLVWSRLRKGYWEELMPQQKG